MIVEFVAIDEEYRNVYDAPVPASSLLPRWHKDKEPYSDGVGVGVGSIVGHVNDTLKYVPTFGIVIVTITLVGVFAVLLNVAEK